jgi:dihydrofolate reductase
MVRRIIMPSISLMIARSEPGGVIGCNNKLPWRLRSDLQRFRKITTNHAVIMGKKTFNSIGSALPNRTNIVLSRELRANNDCHIVAGDQIFWAAGPDAALYLADLISISSGKESFFVIGGQEIYKLFFDGDLINRVYLTEVLANVRGDAFFLHKFPKLKWNMIEKTEYLACNGDEYNSRFIIYERKERRNRERILSSFYTDALSKNKWVEAYLRTHGKKITGYEETHQAELDLARGEIPADY